MAATSMCVRTMSNLSRFSRCILTNRRHVKQTSVNRYSTNTEQEKKGAEDGKAEGPGMESKEYAELKDELAKILKEKEELNVNISDLKDKYMRSLAETENVRTRMKKQVDDAKIFGIQGFCKDLLEVVDILGQATESTPKEEIPKNKHLKDLYEGLTMTNAQLLKVFSRHGLTKIHPNEGEKFDPFFHEALFQVPAPEGKEDGTVAVIQKTGFKLHDRTLRPALVGVFKSS